MQEEIKSNLVTIDLDKFLQYIKEETCGREICDDRWGTYIEHTVDPEIIQQSVELSKTQVPKMKINLEVAPKIIEALKRRKAIDGAEYCPCKPGTKDESIICPCDGMRINGKCCCGLFVID